MSEATDDPGFEGGHARLDSEHQFQVALVTAMVRALRGGRPREEVRAILDQLTSFTDVHFMAEHVLMRLYAYPDYAAHQDEHDRLMDALTVMREALGSGSNAELHAQLDQMHAALLAHIRSSDRALASYVTVREPVTADQ